MATTKSTPKQPAASPNLPTPSINPLHAEALETFLELVPVKRLSQHTRKLLLSYLKHEMPDGPEDFLIDHIGDLENLFDLLDALEQNQPGL